MNTQENGMQKKNITSSVATLKIRAPITYRLLNLHTPIFVNQIAKKQERKQQEMKI